MQKYRAESMFQHIRSLSLSACTYIYRRAKRKNQQQSVPNKTALVDYDCIRRQLHYLHCPNHHLHPDYVKCSLHARVDTHKLLSCLSTLLHMYSRTHYHTWETRYSNSFCRTSQKRKKVHAAK